MSISSGLLMEEDFTSGSACIKLEGKNYSIVLDEAEMNPGSGLAKKSEWVRCELCSWNVLQRLSLVSTI